MNWKRIIGWTLLILVSANLIGVISGLTMANSRIDETTIDNLVKYHRIGRTASIALVAIICYWRLGAGATQSRAAHILAGFLVIQVVDTGLSLILGASLGQLFEPWAMLRSAIYALIGYGLAWQWPNKSFKPRPLRGSA